MLNIFHLLRKNRKSPRSPPKDHHLSDHAAELEQLQLELSRTINSLSKLQMKVAEHDSKLAHDTPSNLTPPPPYELEPPLTHDIPLASSRPGVNIIWIYDIWLCSHNDSFLSDAEHQWQTDRPDLALECAWWLTDHSPSIRKRNLMRLRLFIAALQYSLGDYEASIKSLEVVEELNQFYKVLHNSENMANTGISYFIRGRNLMETKRFQEAYCSFGRVSDSPGYNEKAVEYQTKAIMNFTDIEAAEFGSSRTASTHTLFN